MTVRICTGDRDALQLVDDSVTVLYPMRGVSELTRFTPEEVREKYGLTPAQYPDFAALRGDPSDNLPSIPGVGEKTAAKWVREFGVAPRAGRPGRRGARQGRGRVAGQPVPASCTNRRLTELVREVPLDVGPADLLARQYDREAVHQIFDNLQFRVLRERLLETFEQEDETSSDEGFDIDGGQLPAGTVRAWLDAHARNGRVGIVVPRQSWAPEAATCTRWRWRRRTGRPRSST